MPPEVVTVFIQTINKYGTSLTFHWIILALSGLSEGYQCPCRYFIARLNKIWTIYSHFNGLQPYNAVFLEPNKSFDSPPLLDADARTQAPHTDSYCCCCCWCCWSPSRTRMVFTYAGDVGIRGLERARVDTGPGVACAHYLFIIQAPVTSRGSDTGHTGSRRRDSTMRCQQQQP